MNELPYLKMLEYGNTCTALSLPDFVAGIPLGKEATGARMTAGDGGERSSATSGAGACAIMASPGKSPKSRTQRRRSSHSSSHLSPPPLANPPSWSTAPESPRPTPHLRHPPNQCPSSPPPSLINELSHESPLPVTISSLWHLHRDAGEGSRPQRRKIASMKVADGRRRTEHVRLSAIRLM
jgi:hypothetical protein